MGWSFSAPLSTGIAIGEETNRKRQVISCCKAGKPTLRLRNVRSDKPGGHGDSNKKNSYFASVSAKRKRKKKKIGNGSWMCIHVTDT